MAAKSVCKIEGCGKERYARGWCNSHYQCWRRNGDPLTRNPGKARRFYEEVVLAYEGDDCLPWPYATNGVGYGQIWRGGRIHLVSRLVCEETNGPPPTPKHEAAHSCGNGHLACATKRHLRWATHIENEYDKRAHGTMRLPWMKQQPNSGQPAR